MNARLLRLACTLAVVVAAAAASGCSALLGLDDPVVDDDDDASVGDDANTDCGDTDSDPENCGACGFRCEDQPGVSSEITCSSGSCDYAGFCLPEHAECTEDAPGCESLTAPTSCGDCSVVCEDPTPFCAADKGYVCTDACNDGELVCNGSCANIASDVHHCGRCDHSCGVGGVCDRGVCQPITLHQGAGILELAVGADAIYWSDTDTISTCPLPGGCVLQPRRVADAYDGLGALVVTHGDVYFSGCRGTQCDDMPRVFQCPVSGCPLTAPAAASAPYTFTELAAGPSQGYWLNTAYGLFTCKLDDCQTTKRSWPRASWGSEGLLGLAVDETAVYVKGEAGFWSCPEATGCDSPTPLTGVSSIAPPFRALRGELFWFADGGPNLMRINKCQAASCSSSLVATEEDGLTELEVDDSGVYWINTTTRMIRRCPTTGCVAPPDVVAANLVAPRALTLDRDFVYWLEGDVLKKVAKP